MFKILTAFLLVLSSVQIFSFEPSMTTEEAISEEEQSLAQILSELTEEERQMTLAFLALDWKEAGTYKLYQSNSTISLPEGYKLLIGEEAKKGRKLTCGDLDNPNLEASIYDDIFENVILFENLKDGYVSLDDWKEIDPKSLLETISENTEKANEERKKNGGGELHVVGWIQEPILDKHTNTVYWSIEAESLDEENIVNSVAIKLGREGFEKLVWVTHKSSYVPFGGHLDVMLRSHSFDPGFQYKDYKTGDRIARYGIATLVAATVGGKIVKAGGIAVLFKKIGGLAFAAIAVLFYKFKSIFKRNKEE